MFFFTGTISSRLFFEANKVEAGGWSQSCFLILKMIECFKAKLAFSFACEHLSSTIVKFSLINNLIKGEMFFFEPSAAAEQQVNV